MICLHPQIPDFQIVVISAKYCPIITNHTSLERLFIQLFQVFIHYSCMSHVSSSLSLDLHRQTVQDWTMCHRSSASRRASFTPCGSTCCPTTPTTPYSFPNCCRNWPTCGSWWRSTQSWSRRSTRRRTLHSTRFCRRSTETCTDFETSPFSAYSRDPSEFGTGDKGRSVQRGERSLAVTSLRCAPADRIKHGRDIVD